MNQPVILLENVTKQYYLEKPRTFKKWFHNLFSPFDKFTVIKNFSLSVNKGEFVLILGSNGSGKTTILRMIAGITEPDSGIVKTYGKVVPLIEFGAGFNYELTGKENIIINATILGISKDKIHIIMPNIISFSGLRNFIDIPVKRYSSGMVSRLAFSIATFSEPDILLLDEIFVVGDEKFRKKSVERLKKFKKEGGTVILTTHINYKFDFIDRHIQLKDSASLKDV